MKSRGGGASKHSHRRTISFGSVHFSTFEDPQDSPRTVHEEEQRQQPINERSTAATVQTNNEITTSNSSSSEDIANRAHVSPSSPSNTHHSEAASSRMNMNHSNHSNHSIHSNGGGGGGGGSSRIRHSMSSYSISSSSSGNNRSSLRLNPSSSFHHIPSINGINSLSSLTNSTSALNSSRGHPTTASLMSRSMSGSFDNLSGLRSARRHTMTKQEELKLRNEMNMRRENFESVDFFSTIQDDGSDDDDDDDSSKSDEENDDEDDDDDDNDASGVNEEDELADEEGHAHPSSHDGSGNTGNDTSNTFAKLPSIKLHLGASDPETSVSLSGADVNPQSSIKRQNERPLRLSGKRPSSLKLHARSPTMDSLGSPIGGSSTDINMDETQDALSLANLNKHRKTIWKRTKRILSIVVYPVRKVLTIEVRAVIFLAILGVLGALANLFTDIMITKLEVARTNLAALTPSFAGNYTLSIIYSICLAFLAAACTQFISPFSGGSGIPEMKSILSGNSMERYLSFQTLVAKLLGIIASVASGLSIGRLGPFVHISSCIANQLMNVKFFRKLKRAESERSGLLAAACASGVATAFGAPFGGVLFSIEVTSTFYPVKNLSRCIFCTLFGSLAFYVWRKLGLVGSTDSYLFSTDFGVFSYKIDEIFLFVIVGVICGLLGAFFNFMLSWMIEFRMGLNLVRARRYLLIASVAIITTTIAFPLDPLLRKSSNTVVNILFSREPLNVVLPIPQLFIMIVAKYILTTLALILPLPCGVFAPVFTIGAAVGRLFGEVVKVFYGSRFSYIVPAYYSVVGASSLASGVTRSLSTIVIVFELTGQFSLMIPVMISSIVAVGIANFFNECLYDRLMMLRGLPYLTELKNVESHKMKASEIMRTDLCYVTTNLDPVAVKQTIELNTHTIFPVVDDHESMTLVGSVSRAQLEEFLKAVNAYSNLKNKTDKKKKEKLKANPQKKKIQYSMDALRQEIQQLRHVAGVKTTAKSWLTPRPPVSQLNVVDEEATAIEEDAPLVNIGSYSAPLNSDPILVYKYPSTDQKASREFYIQFDSSPLTISIFTPLTKLHFLFATLRPSHIWVTAGGKLVGVVAKKDMIDAKL